MYTAVITTTTLASICINHYVEGRKKCLQIESPVETEHAGQYKKSLPVYTLEDVAEHATKNDRIWVTYGQGVYDITDFVEEHPGGDKILMAAGGSLEPFWLLYAVHKNPHVFALLEQFRIGNLKEDESSDILSNMEDPYELEPRRHPALKPASVKPFNAEPPLQLLVDSFITPSDLFYVRNHLPVPEVDPETYSLEITGVGVKTIFLSLHDIKTKFPKYTVTAAVQCAGNRRSEMSEVKPVKGLSWGPAAIGNATWSGARLYDVLKAAGLEEDHPGVEHVQFEGLDTDAANLPYGASIPIEKAMNRKAEVILAYEINGEPLPRDHGYPIRVIAPGIVGARSVKWLGRIVVSEEESTSHWQRNDYKGFSPSVDWDTVDFTKSPAIQELPVTSAICDPVQGDTVTLTPEGKMVVRGESTYGYAWSGGGQKIVRVDVTADGGKVWHVAHFTGQDTKSKTPYHWGWTLWKAEIPIPAGEKQVELWVKAVDSSYNTQPENFENIWNLRGVLNTAYHRVRVNINQTKK
ncbi:sulfite oxidase isoform X3 [Cryptotermes secundus]|nr:sulfite oxidase isoform X3 [Cryptotermes secundus]